MKEEDIRPKDVFKEFLHLAAADVVTFFAQAPCCEVPCPACKHSGKLAFHKEGFDYAECPACHTLYVSPRPVAEAFARYYIEAPSVKFWASTFYKVTAETRREKLWKPKAQMISERLMVYSSNGHSVIDIGGGYGIFAEEMQKLNGNPVTVIEPGPELAEVCRLRELTVVQKFLEDVSDSDLPEGPRAFVSFELFEHLHDPFQFLASLRSLMQFGDLFLFTTLSGTGVDIQALWENDKAVSPPHHLNFFNPMSIRLLLERASLETLEVTTPGKLDLDILCNNREQIKDRFWRTFLEFASEETIAQWQELISSSGWSSHMLVCCRKPG